MRYLKAIIKTHLKTLSHLFSGQTFSYATNYSPDASFQHEWISSETPIKIRQGLGNLNQNRLSNMRLAISKLNNLQINPQEVFRFWKYVPYPSKKNGFLEGPSISNGILKTDFGGGLCQVSSTLFNAFLLANFQIIERFNHSIDAHGEGRFVPLGRDATVAYGYKDLIVRNVNRVPLRLELNLDENDMKFCVSIKGQIPCPFKVEITNQVIKELLPSSANGMSGWEVVTERYVEFLNGTTQSKREKTYHSYDAYKPHAGTI